MKNQKGKSILVIVLFLLLTVGCAYIDIFGLMGSGKAEDITLGLDLAGGVSIVYEIADEDANAEAVEDTIERLEKMDVTVYRTDKNGNIVFVSDGQQLEIIKERN